MKTKSHKDHSIINDEEKQKIKEIHTIYDEIFRQLHQRIVGLDHIIAEILISIFSAGHTLLIGVPGLAKTLLIRCVSDLLDLKFSRIQFTPDLMPSDITGTEILVEDEETKSRHFKFIQGPIFANLILADELNRTPPKTQAALLEAMEEYTVTSLGQRFHLEAPFYVMATQNPIEQEGTYPLPAAQLDRFMFNLLLDYPCVEEERKIMRMTLSTDTKLFDPILSQEKILDFLKISRKLPASPEVMKYAIEICRKSRPEDELADDMIKEYVAWGVSPRAPQCLLLGGKARALLSGRSFVISEDIRAIAHSVMRHRIILNYKAEVADITVDEIVDHLLEKTMAPDGEVKNLKRKHYNKKLYLHVLGQS